VQKQQRNDVGEPQASDSDRGPFTQGSFVNPSALYAPRSSGICTSQEKKKTAERCVSECTIAYVRLRDPHAMDGVVPVW
jgi:hypothetical protein